MRNTMIVSALAGLGVLVGGLAFAQQHGHGAHSGHPPPGKAIADMRVLVAFPPELQEHTLSNMRDHLFALQEIQEALAKGEHDKAAKIAEERLGMTSLKLHGAHEVAKYMPQGMQDAGSEMHRSASRFAIEAQNSGVTGDLRPALGALATVTGQCVGCHAGYRLK